MTGQVEEYMGALAMLKAIPAELKLVIAGNHDLSLHRELYLNSKNKIGELYAQRLDRRYDQRKWKLRRNCGWVRKQRQRE